MPEVTIKRRRLYQRTAFSSSYSLAATLGHPFIDNSTTRVDESGTVLVRFTQEPTRLGPAVWVGLANNQRHYIVEDES